MTREARTSRPALDLVNGPIMPTLLRLAVPTLMLNAVTAMSTSINAAWVGRLLGQDALAAIANANLLVLLLLSLMFGFGLAAAIFIGQSFGRRDVDAARRMMGTAITAFAVASLIATLVAVLGAPLILRAMDTPAESLPLASTYLRHYAIGLPALFLISILSAGLRSGGEVTTPLRIAIQSAMIDAVVNPLLILGLGPLPQLGLAGSGLSTAIANYASLATLVWTIYQHDLPIRLRNSEWRYLKPRGVLLRPLLTKGWLIGSQVIAGAGSAAAMMAVVNRQGVVFTAAYGTIQLIWAYIQMPALAIGAAASAMAAQNIGAGRWPRVNRIAMAGVLVNIALTGFLVLLVTLFDGPLLSIFFGSNSAAIGIAAHIHRIVGPSWVLFGITSVLFAVVRANAVVVGPLLILLISLFPVRFGIMWLLMPMFGVEAIWWGITIGSIAASIMAIAFYLRHDWQRPAVRRVAAAGSTGGGRPASA